MSKIWKVAPRKFSDLKSQLLFNRGLKSPGEIEDFLEPRLETFEPLLKIAGMDKAWKRITRAIESQELIVIYGDYDVDGICASAILYKALTSLGAKVLPYIPHREKEGYGLSEAGLEFARDGGAAVVITVDNGIVALEAAKFAKKIGLDLIITDHHLPLAEKPEAYSIVHSTQMCGAAVAWCLIRERVKKELAKELLQFVAIATVCDLIPLLGLGRALVVEGLKVLNHTHNLGLLALINQAGLSSGSLGAYEIGHILGPRLNAIGRLEHAIDALRLLCTKDPEKARRLSSLLNEANAERQRLTMNAFEEARLLTNAEAEKNIYIVGSKDWLPGIIGLVAGKVCEEYSRPAIALSIGETITKGSARSVDGINIVEVIRQCSPLLLDVGGHKGAAGFSLLSENINKFRETLGGITVSLPSGIQPVLEIEAEVESSQLTKALALSLEEFAPFGMSNPQPLLVSKAMKITDIRTVGEGGKHLKFLADGIGVIAFGMGSLKELLVSGQLVDLAYSLEINRFNGQQLLQLKVRDIIIGSGG